MILNKVRNKLDLFREEKKRVRTLLFWSANLFLLLGIFTHLFFYPN